MPIKLTDVRDDWMGNTSLSFEIKHPIFCQNVILQNVAPHNSSKETLNEVRTKYLFPKQEVLFDKLFERAQSVKYMKDVLATILLTNLIYHLQELLPIRQRIRQDLYMCVTTAKVVELTEHGYF